MDIESHPLKPFIPEKARLLMLGSFPPARHRWSMDFFYPNFQNDMWRIFGLVFYGDKDHFVDNESRTFRREEIESLLNEQGIALYDTASEVIRTQNTASDKDLQVVTPTDLDSLLQRMPMLEAVVTTGQKATDLFTTHFQMAQPKVGESETFTFGDRQLRLWRMPSSSRAYPMNVEKKAEKYMKVLLARCQDNGTA